MGIYLLAAGKEKKIRGDTLDAGPGHVVDGRGQRPFRPFSGDASNASHVGITAQIDDLLSKHRSNSIRSEDHKVVLTGKELKEERRRKNTFRTRPIA